MTKPRWDKVQKWLFSPYTLALFFTIIVAFLLPDLFSKYHFQLFREDNIDKSGGMESYYDLDHDGSDERIICFDNTQGEASLKIMDKSGFIMHHAYFRGQIIHQGNSVLAGAIDSSGREYIFLFSRSHDSVFLHAADPSGENRHLFDNVFLTRVSERNGKYDFSLSSVYLADLDRDGSSEVIVGIMAGFPLVPRVTVAYDIRRKKVSMTPPMGTLSGVTDVDDINGDGFPELLLSTYAVYNEPDSARKPYSDHSAWLMVLDRELQFLFPPPEFRGIYTSAISRSFHRNGKIFLATLVYSRTSRIQHPRLMLSAPDGTGILTRLLPDTMERHDYTIFTTGKGKDRLYLLRDGGVVREYNEQLETVREFTLPGMLFSNPRALDIDNDGEEELVFPGDGAHPTIITRNDFSHPLVIPVPFGDELLRMTGARKVSGALPCVFFQSGNRYFLYSYGRNPWYYFRFIVYLLIYLCFLGFIEGIRLLQKRVVKRQYTAEKQAARLQLLLLKNQIGPHFTFNGLNSIAALVKMQDHEKAYSFTLKFSHLLRETLNSADKTTRKLFEELDFVRNYLDIQKIRFQDAFDYTITLDPHVDQQVSVPIMVIQTYAENTVKHGLPGLEKKGQVKIQVLQEEQFLLLSIEDNGIGREAGIANANGGTGKGLRTMKEFYEHFNSFNRNPITETFTDLYDSEGSPAGTRVEIRIPIKFDYSFASPDRQV